MEFYKIYAEENDPVIVLARIGREASVININNPLDVKLFIDESTVWLEIVINKLIALNAVNDKLFEHLENADGMIEVGVRPEAIREYIQSGLTETNNAKGE